jgi:hypothetical protein
MASIQWITNSGTSDWSISSNWSPASVPGAADSATIGVGGTVTVTVNTAESVGSLTLADANATVALNNSLALGTTLDLTAGKFDLKSGGTIVGGTITGSGLLSQGGTLSGVTDDGTLDLSTNGSRLTVDAAGITLTGTSGTGPGSLLLTGGNSYLTFKGTQTLDNAAVSIGGTSGAGFFYATGAGTTLTLGPTLSMTQTGGARLYANAGAAIVNTGTINAGVTNGTMYLRGTGGFTNQGTISISNGDDFDVAAGVAFANPGTITLGSGGKLHLRDNLTTGAIGTVSSSGGTVFIDGTLTNTGSVLATGTAGAGTVAVTGLITGGTITGSGLLARGGTVSGVTNDGTLDLSTNGSRLTVTNGITLFGAGGTGPGSVLLTGGNSYLTFSGTQTFDNAAVSIGGTSGAGFFYATGAGTTLTLGPTLSMTQTGGARLYANAGAAIVNAGTITAGRTNGTMYLRGGGSFTNQGTISVSNGDDFDVAAGVAFANSGTIVLASGGKLHLRDNLTTARDRDGQQYRRHGVHRRHADQYRQRAGDRECRRRDGRGGRHDYRGDDHRVEPAGPRRDFAGCDQPGHARPVDKRLAPRHRRGRHHSNRGGRRRPRDRAADRRQQLSDVQRGANPRQRDVQYRRHERRRISLRDGCRHDADVRPNPVAEPHRGCPALRQ